jgi:hypothetical protein
MLFSRFYYFLLCLCACDFFQTSLSFRLNVASRNCFSQLSPLLHLHKHERGKSVSAFSAPLFSPRPFVKLRPFFKLDVVTNEALLNVLESDSLLSSAATSAVTTSTDLPIELYYPSTRNQYSRLYLYLYYKYPKFFQFISFYTTWFYEQWSFSVDFFTNLAILFVGGYILFAGILPLLMGRKFTETLYRKPPSLLPFQMKMINESYNKFLAIDINQNTYVYKQWNSKSYLIRPVFVCSNCSSVMNSKMPNLPKPSNYLEYDSYKEIYGNPEFSSWKKKLLKIYEKLSKISFTNNGVFQFIYKYVFMSVGWLFLDEDIYYCLHCGAPWEHFYNRYDPFDPRALKKWIIIHPEDSKEIEEFVSSVESKYAVKEIPVLETEAEAEREEEETKSKK